MPVNRNALSSFTVRIHLDDADEKNGALRILPRSHFSLLTTEEIAQLRETVDSSFCKVKKGEVHLMKPLTLHASSNTENDKHRRVIHLDFSNQEFPGGLGWLEREELG